MAWPDEAACRTTASRLAGRPALHDACIELHGPLGVGKTTFVRHLLRALGVAGPVKSPSYAVMEPYELPAPGAGGEGPGEGARAAWHFDFYRFDDPQEWEDAGFRDVYASRGLKLAEWPDKAAGLLPAPDLRIDIALAGASGAARVPGQDDDGDIGAGRDLPRHARFDALSPRGLELLP